jgi:hypothetical protein
MPSRHGDEHVIFSQNWSIPFGRSIKIPVSIHSFTEEAIGGMEQNGELELTKGLQLSTCKMRPEMKIT